jgi:hypothetical protein
VSGRELVGRRVEEVLQQWKSRDKVGRRIWRQRYKHETSISNPRYGAY